MLYIPVVIALLFFTGCGNRQPTSTTPEHLWNQAALAMEEDDYAKAAALFRQATKLNPDLAEAWVGLGASLVQIDHVAEARSSYQQALEIYSERYAAAPSPNDLMSQSFVLLLLGKSDEAEALLAKGEQTHPTASMITTLRRGFSELSTSGIHKWQIPYE